MTKVKCLKDDVTYKLEVNISHDTVSKLIAILEYVNLEHEDLEELMDELNSCAIRPTDRYETLLSNSQIDLKPNLPF